MFQRLGHGNLLEIIILPTTDSIGIIIGFFVCFLRNRFQKKKTPFIPVSF
jgi:hypothetical protein